MEADPQSMQECDTTSSISMVLAIQMLQQAWSILLAFIDGQA
jgi:hypothetical protein